jgi:hypothetical protein
LRVCLLVYVVVLAVALGGCALVILCAHNLVARHLVACWLEAGCLNDFDQDSHDD